jgi:hypothetical protein
MHFQEEAEEARRRGAGLLGVQGLHERPPASAVASASLPCPTPPSTLPPSSLPPVRGSVNGDETPRRLGLGARGGTAAATYGRGAVRGYVDDGDAAEARGAHCDGGHARRGRALASASAKEVKGRMTTATSS